MTHSALALQCAIYSILKNDNDITTLLGGEFIFDDVPKKQTPPYIVFSEAIHSDWSTGSETGIEHTVTLNIWSSENGRKQVLLISDAIINALIDIPAMLDGHALINFTHEFTEVAKDEQTKFFLAKVNFRAVTEPQIINP